MKQQLLYIFIFTSITLAQSPEWTNYTSSNSGLPDNYVNAIAVDENNNKWIGTTLGGLAVFDDDTWATYDTSNSGIPGNWITSIAIEGNIKWLGTAPGGFVKYDGSSWTSYDPTNSPLVDGL